MSPQVAERITLAGQAGARSPIATHHLVCYPQLALAIKHYMRDDPVHCTRLVAQTVAHLSELTDPADIAAFHLRPPTTGDPHWNNLIRGVAAHTWATSGRRESLNWTRTAATATSFWTPVESPAWRNWNLVQTPSALRDRGVIYPRSWLETV
ncbi:MAG: hypothetical protein LBH13_00785 [Cellulomonadaceae bacterium]|jgi:hypothetical protein|nr:hypothetical protein [Cellulomonadaceae bacterium]